MKITIELEPYEYWRENKSQRKERVQNSKPLYTRTEQKKKAYRRHDKHKKKYEYG